MARCRKQTRVALGLLVCAGAVLAGVVVWSLATIPLAVRSAEAVAEAEPYCIQVAREMGYKTTENLFDLNALSMWALYNDMGSYFNYHAILMVGTGSSRRVFNWSHSKGKFEFLEERYYHSPDTVRRIPSCEPRPHFLSTLPWF